MDERDLLTVGIAAAFGVACGIIHMQRRLIVEQRLALVSAYALIEAAKRGMMDTTLGAREALATVRDLHYAGGDVTGELDAFLRILDDNIAQMQEHVA